MTYAEVKNQFTTVESIDNRLAQIESSREIGQTLYVEAKKKYAEDINNILSEFNITSYVCMDNVDEQSITLRRADKDSFYDLRIWAGYDYDWKNQANKWKYELNVGSYGNFPLDDVQDEKMKKVVDYYALVGAILTNKEMREKIEGVCHDNVDNLKKIYKDHSYNSEEKQLLILRNNMIKEATYGKQLLEVMEAEDKHCLVIVKKDVNDNEANAICRGNKVKVVTGILPNSDETWSEVNAKMKEIRKSDKEGNYAFSQIRFLKFDLNA